jgi:hypothetical protein
MSLSSIVPARLRTASMALLLGPLTLACGSEDGKKSGSLEITVSAEALGANGYAFPPAAGQEVAFVDGWAVNFQRIIVAVANIRLSEVPDKDPGDQSVVGKEVAVRPGPYVLDLKMPGNAVDKGSAGMVAIRLPIDDLTGPFDLEQRYAFSYDLVDVTPNATFVNVAADDPDVLSMIESGQRVLMTGRAEFKGQSCISSVASYDFSSLPTPVDFRFGLEGPVSYVNCQNPDNTGEAIEGEEFQRGIQLLPNGVTTAQITVHTDHLFWPTTTHENLPLFNQFAANASPSGAAASVDLEMLESVPVPIVTDRNGADLPWRSCVDASMYVLPTQPATMTFDAGTLEITNLHDFVQFNAMTMGHLNADGLCYVAGAAHSHSHSH